ncbi:hypothetical protein C8J57DRAFT_1248615 [Mycena rebaudengoi]|nr:hypothetical protein C8J57DRAFT_1248615 [Mycena rebaudengoi]
MEDAEDLVKKAKKAKVQVERQKARDEQLWDHGQLPAEWDDEVGELPGKVGDGERGSKNMWKISWIWTGAETDGMDTDVEDALRVEWSKVWARTRCWDKEVWLLEEYRRLLATLEYEACHWDRCAVAVPIGDIGVQEAQGAVAYAVRQVAIFRDMSVRATVTWTEEKLGKGWKRARMQLLVSGYMLGNAEEEADEDKEARERREVEEEEELLRGDVGSDQEDYIVEVDGEDD